MSAAAPVEREWQRHGAGERLARFVVYLVIVAAVVLSIRTVEVIPDFILDAPEQVADLLARWRKSDGSFRSRRLMLGWDNVPMHRWAQAQLFRSLCLLLNRSAAPTALTRSF